MKTHSMIAIDMGASNGRVVHARLEDGRISLRELHRFPNEPQTLNGMFYWDVLRLLGDMKKGLAAAVEQGLDFGTVAVSSWGNTIGLLDHAGDLMMNPIHYRDTRQLEILGALHGRVSPEEMFRATWYIPMSIQPAVFLNYLKQNKPWIFENIDRALMICDLFNYLLSGKCASERTMAATSGLVSMDTLDWERSYMERLGLRGDIFPDIVENGTVLGELALAEELGIHGPAPQVVAVSGHDTAAASFCTHGEAEAESLYLSCGTWSCMGCTVRDTVREEKVLRLGLTNDVGLYGQRHLRFNHTGLWILQECRREWALAGREYTYAQLADMAQAAKPFAAFIDTEAGDFFFGGRMPEKVREYCSRTGQQAPDSPGQICRVILESLALRYRYSRDAMEKCSGDAYTQLSMLGGGGRNALLCQFTADALGVPVHAGPFEATTIGNCVQQAIAAGAIADVRQGREVAERSERIETYTPQNTAVWDKNYEKALKLAGWQL